MLVIPARLDAPYNPFLVFDGKKLLALFRDKNEIVKLEFIHRKVLKILKEMEELSITEMDADSNPVRQYTVKMVFDSNLKRKLKKEKDVLC